VKSSQYVGYTAHWNLVDYAVISMPVEVDYPEDLPATDDGWSSWREHKPMNESDRYNWEQCKLTGALAVEW
jgi:amidase